MLNIQLYQDGVNHISTGTHLVKEGGVPPQTGGDPPTTGYNSTRKVANSLRVHYFPKNYHSGGYPKNGQKCQKWGKKGQIGRAEKASARPILCCVALPGNALFVGRFDRWGTEIVQNTPPSEKKIVLIPTSSNFRFLLALY